MPEKQSFSEHIESMEVFSMNEKEAKWLLIGCCDDKMEEFEEK